MTLFPEYSAQQGGRAALLSIKPRFANLILAGSKHIEFRRSWPHTDVGVLILYSSSPVQRLVGVAYVDKVVEADAQGLWKLSEEYGGGLEYDELVEYFEGKRRAFGILLKSVDVAANEVDPKELFSQFRPPQSYQYLSPAEYKSTMNRLFPDRAPL